MSGALYVVATPIGNLEDITLRALRILKQAAVIACEDTRQTRKLLEHYGITTRTVSYHEHNEAQRTPELLARLKAGESVALVSDAGTPLISDPGYRLVRAAIAEGIAVVPVPGPSALLAAVAGAGLPTDAFRFGGFLPPKSGPRRKALEAAAGDAATLVFYEAPHRILETLADLEAVLGDRPVVVARELTKVHEEFLRGTARQIRVQLALRPSIKGEMVILVGKGAAPAAASSSLGQAVQELEKGGMSRMDAIKQVARERGLSKREVYRLVH